MSRIGKAPITIPVGVDIKIDGNQVTVKGPKGQLSRDFHRDMEFGREDGTVVVRRPSDEQRHRELHGLTRALLANMVLGVTDGFEKVLEIEGTGYRAESDGDVLVLSLGYSHLVRYTPPSGVSFEIENRGKKITVRGIDKEAVGQSAVDIRSKRPPEPYKGKGVRYQGEHIRRKAGKAGKVGV
jgi:large subunit ribosomal protein L6